MRYLTVQDLLWINLQITGAPQAYDYATLEEATFYQYAKGDSTELVSQAARFLTGFNRLSPFADGNEPTGFIGCLAFLEANGHTIDLDDVSAADWLRGAVSNLSAAKVAISDHLREHESHERYGVPNTQEIVDGLLTKFSDTLQSLTRAAA